MISVAFVKGDPHANHRFGKLITISLETPDVFCGISIANCRYRIVLQKN